MTLHYVMYSKRGICHDCSQGYICTSDGDIVCECGIKTDTSNLKGEMKVILI